jgi:hypothetical protein
MWRLASLVALTALGGRAAGVEASSYYSGAMLRSATRPAIRMVWLGWVAYGSSAAAATGTAGASSMGIALLRLARWLSSCSGHMGCQGHWAATPGIIDTGTCSLLT